MLQGFFRSCLMLALVIGCGSSTSNGAGSDSAAGAKSAGLEAPEETPASGGMPKHCARGKKYRGECVPPPGWVKRLCADVYPEVALQMFKPNTPWKRLYMLANAEPFNASGGASLLGDKLRRGEEVIALHRRGNDAGIQVGDTAGYDVLRWNGACATIHDGDFSDEQPKRVVYSKIEWRRLALPFRNALEAQPNISAAYETRRKACKGQSIGIVAADCERYDQEFMDEIVRYVQEGGKLPAPTKMP